MMLNQYPVKTVVDGKVLRNCRLVAEGSGATLWRWDKEAGTAVLLLQTSAPPERMGATEKWLVGDLVVEPQRGCGCSHPMYTFVPSLGRPA